REIQEGLGISSTSVVARCLAALEAAGCIQRTARSSRSIVVLPAGHEALR
ncbi:MAG: hypothetical protein KC492_07050, partial [Myxococcales bacterium]|nr:hypothetical protein [Myxococcales bacterium]